VEGELDLIEHHDRRARLVEDLVGGLCPARCVHQYIVAIRILVTKKSTAITATDPVTTATVVASPTPWVPPLVRSPTWQAVVTITKPSTNGLINPIQTSWL